ncbi:MAG: molybdopterin-synthase adenylyltransferase MoeB [Planctomycetes bacterium]|nr:molybdopterin-synthase adenylyltransferase MoeB [Planctomycetota bacterium]
MSVRQERIERLRAEIAELAPREAAALRAAGAVLIDVREAEELVAGSPAGAVHLPRGFLELRIEELVPELDRTVLLSCQTGLRSLFAADNLRRLGYRDVRSVAGGFARWRSEGLPIDLPRGLSTQERERYGRHLLVPGVGESGQRKLLDARVLLVGAGGLGSPAALYLAAAGVGHLRVVDFDVVERSNLQRQILHADDRIGQGKAESARRSLLALNPGIAVEPIAVRLDATNVEALMADCQVVLDGTDNFATRYLVNDACVKLGIPNVHGAIHRFEGQVSTFWPQSPGRRGPCYRCLFPSPPPADLAPNCAEAGVLGVLPGVIGTLQAVETIKLILGLGDPLVGRLLVYDALAARFFELEQARDPSCARCADGRTDSAYESVETSCAPAAVGRLPGSG